MLNQYAIRNVAISSTLNSPFFVRHKFCLFNYFLFNLYFAKNLQKLYPSQFFLKKSLIFVNYVNFE